MSVPLYSLTDQWTDGGTTYDAIRMTVTDTAFAAGSSFFNFRQYGATTPQTIVGAYAISAAGNLSQDGFLLNNPNVAAAGVQQFSPRLHLVGQGWKTNATAGSQTLDWIFEIQPQQNTSSPLNYLICSAQTNAGGYQQMFQIAQDTVNSQSQFVVLTPNSSWSGYFKMFIGAQQAVEMIAHTAGLIIFQSSFTYPLQFGYNGTRYINFDTSGFLSGVPIGYSSNFAATGGAVTQLTSRTTAVTLNTVCGAITMFNAAGSATAATFTVNNTKVAATDTIILNQKSGTNLYVFIVTAVAANSFNITFFTTGGTAADSPVINFAIIKAVNA